MNDRRTREIADGSLPHPRSVSARGGCCSAEWHLGASGPCAAQARRSFLGDAVTRLASRKTPDFLQW